MYSSAACRGSNSLRNHVSEVEKLLQRIISIIRQRSRDDQEVMASIALYSLLQPACSGNDSGFLLDNTLS